MCLFVAKTYSSSFDGSDFRGLANGYGAEWIFWAELREWVTKSVDKECDQYEHD